MSSCLKVRENLVGLESRPISTGWPLTVNWKSLERLLR